MEMFVMKLMKGTIGILTLAATVAFAASLSAQTLKVLTAGSSAQFGPFAVAAYALATAPPTGSTTPTPAFHYTVKSGTCTTGSTTCYASVADSRNSAIQNEPGNLWVVWSSNGIWAYLSVDSTVGVRAFSAVPRATLALATTLPLSSTTNYTYWADGTNDTALTSTVYAALNGIAFTAANTDIRPEDALFATNRALNSLGYGSVADTRTGHSGQFLIGNPIESHFTPTTSVAHPVSFAIAGGVDPFSTTGQVGPTQITLPIGAAPIVFVASTAGSSTVASATNITSANAASLFSGLGACAASLVTGATGAIDPVLREPLSGTMNTTEFTVFMPGDPSTGSSQETGITTPTVGSTQNPLALPCGSGFRYRAIGTGDEVNNVIATPNTLGYAFFSYESVGGGHTDRYLQLNSVDPINATYSTGVLPTCAVSGGSYSCPATLGSTFPNLRNGSYTAWSIYRMITDSAGQANAQTLVAESNALVDLAIPDFVPFIPFCGATAGTSEPGLTRYREHFVPSTITTVPDSISITPNDGSRGTAVNCGAFSLPYHALGGGTEAGGDVGGTIITTGTTTESQPH
jgi:hypothetical protein